MRILPVLICFFLQFQIQAQEITVLDRETGTPLPNVAVYNETKSKSVLTDFAGKADISDFRAGETLIFKTVSHYEFKTNKAAIRANNYRVHLKPDENQLQEVLLSVSKFQQNRKNNPQQVISISTEEIKFANPQTAADLLQRSGGVYVQKSQLGGGSPMIRGFATNRLLLNVDGVRMNNAIFRGGNIQNIISIDPLAVEQVEVVLGPGAVIYGSDAIGGVMNFFTLQPRFSLQETTRVNGNVYSRYAGANNERTIHADVNIGRRNWAFLSSITYSDFGDLRMGSHGPEEFLRKEYVVRRSGMDQVVQNPDPGVQVPTGYEQINLLQKISYLHNEMWDFDLNAYYSTTSDLPRYDRLYQRRRGELRFAEWYYGPQRWFFGNFQINKAGKGPLYDKAQLTLAYQYFEESRNSRSFGENILYNSRENVDAWSASLDFEKLFGDNRLYYGLEYVLNGVSSRAERINILTNMSVPDISRYPDGSSWESLAAYSSFQWEIEPELVLQTGLRYNHVFLQADFDRNLGFPVENANLSTGALTGSTGLSWNPSEEISWKINLSTAFRAPNIDDVGKIFDSEPGSVVVPNPGLKPEYAYNAEIGTDWKPADFVQLDLSAFYTYLDNAMVRRDFELNGADTINYQGEPSNVQAIQNAAKAYVYGLEAGVRLQLAKQLRLRSQLTYTKGREEQEDGSAAALRHAAPLFGNTHLVWKAKKLTLDLFSEYNGELEFEELAPEEQRKAFLYATDENGDPYYPSWYTINFTGRYEIDEHWKATASLENITDQRYRTYSSGIAAAGRNLILSLMYTF